MANQRKKGVERITLTIPDDLLRQIEAEVAKTEVDRLALIREAISEYLAKRNQLSTSKSNESKEKKSKPPS